MKKMAVIFLFFFLLLSVQSFAFWGDLNQEQTEQALEYGKDLTNKLGRDSEWVVASERAGWVELATPFSAVAQLARDYSLKGKPIREKDIKRAIRPYKGKLIFNYYHYDIEKRFISEAESEYFAMIRTSDQRIIYPLRHDKGTELVRKISLEFSFLSKKIEPESIIVLLVREPSGFEHEFQFDLSKIR